ncbi:hypothetical protein phytr_1840 [Candidatus Phycorickettsia trachydisci]|uniref:Uncharacterized protein n=1 Tax=Candidatus Phycorickettsia trachydisci TaxID=2115978 RepID=A0A2P1P7A1_9RICK|nr:phage head-tail connector protein [Candidatus Phycorickettsia trachydisci]AVP87142.1 hypothetical protein phytr_1840 [Candidatus Phycorickettsia trachydisci]
MYRVTSSFPDQIINVEEAKGFLKISHYDDDHFIKNCISTAIETAENFLHCHICSKNIEVTIEVKAQEVEMPITPIKRIIEVRCDSTSDDIKDLCQIGLDKTTIILPDNVKGKVAFTYQTERMHLAHLLKHALMSHMEILYEKHVLSNEELDQISNFYKPYRKILV